MKLFKEFYRGNAFSGTVWYAPRVNQPDNLLGYTATSTVLDSAGNRHAGTCTISQDGLSIEIVFGGESTSSWARGSANWNVKFQFGDDDTTSFSTNVWTFDVKEPPTI